MTITVLWPCDRAKVWISNTWSQHLARPGYSREYAGTDLAGPEQPLRPSQYNPKVLQAMWSNLGYGYTVLLEYAGILRTRTAHQKNLGVQIGQIVNPSNSLGILDSTGNSTGNHVHWEVWLKYNGTWKNIDPLNAENGVQLVNDPALLIPLDDTVIIPPPPLFVVPESPTLKNVRTMVGINEINLRTNPRVSGKLIGKVKKCEVWQFIALRVDLLGNTWYAVMRNDVIGWACAHFNGVPWMEEVKQL